MKKVNVLLFRGKGIISALIRWQTRGNYSHAAIRLENGDIIESWQGGDHCVRLTSIRDWTTIDSFTAEVTDEQYSKITNFLYGQIGRPYDFLAIARFLTRRSFNQDNGKWFCSELVFAAFQKAGIELFTNTEAWEVSPQLLSRTPLIRKDSKLYWQYPEAEITTTTEPSENTSRNAFGSTESA